MKRQNVLYPKAAKALKAMGENLRLARRRRKIAANDILGRDLQKGIHAMTNAALRGKPDAGNPHVRFDEREVAKPRRGSLLDKKCSVLAALTCAAIACYGNNPAGENPDLEKGKLGWRISAPNFSVRDGVGRNGSKGLVWEGIDTNRYCITSYGVPFRTGQKLRIRIWIRNESLSKGEPGFCVEFYDSKNRYMSGVGSKECPDQPKAEKGAWRQFEAETGAIPPGTCRCAVDLSVGKDVTGRCIYDDIEVETYGEANDGLFYSSAPDDRAFDGKVRLFGETWADLRAIAPTNLEVVFAVDTPAGRRRLAPDTFENGRAECLIDVSQLKMGLQRMQFLVRTKDDRELDERRLPFERLAAPPKAKVWFDRHRRMIVDGKPVYPLLMYVGAFWIPENPRTFEALDGSPFKMVLSYNQYMTREELDRYQALGIRVIPSFCSAYRRGWRAPVEIGETCDELAFILERMRMIKDHPAVLGWYLSDEPSKEHMARCRERYKLVKRFDPDHPVVNVLCHAALSRDAMATCDIVGLDKYPINIPGTEETRPANLFDVATAVRAGVAGTRGDKPFWFVPQSFPWDPKRERFPTFHEMRSMVWQSIACGADGVLFYSLGEMLNIPENSRYRFDASWKITCAVAQEIADRSEMLLSTEPAPVLADVPATVAARAWRLRGKTLLAAANLAHRHVTCTIRMDGHPVALAFGPYDVILR